MQRCIRAVKLRQVTVGVFLHIDTGVILIGDRSLFDSNINEGFQISKRFVGNEQLEVTLIHGLWVCLGAFKGRWRVRLSNLLFNWAK